MASKESSYPNAWFDKGKQDLEASQVLIKAGNFSIAAFHIQQALEKCLKGFLLANGWKLQRTHDLEKLLDDAVGYEGKLNEQRLLCQTATEYYIEERYPFVEVSKFTQAELLAVYQKAEQFVNLLFSLSKK